MMMYNIDRKKVSFFLTVSGEKIQIKGELMTIFKLKKEYNVISVVLNNRDLVPNATKTGNCEYFIDKMRYHDFIPCLEIYCGNTSIMIT